LAQQNRRTAPPPATLADNRTFFEKLFGASPSEPVLAYARPEDGVLGNARGLTSSPPPRYDRWTAVYDVAAHTVYLPNGTRLEAHSGLHDRLDDPRHVNERMRGATPPNVYELAPREQLFHGVQALRLKPVGSGDIFGRAGLLAHTYMLGPKGESNGCVVFKNYNAFLQAFQNGQVKRLIVVDNLKVRKGYELTLAQGSFAPIPLKKSVFGDEPKFAGPWARESKKDLGGTRKLTLN
jgi:hypothetical protein